MKGWTFLKSRFKRLIIPWIVAVLTLIPLYKIIFLYSRNLPQESWTTYFHWSNGIWSQNWLWFLPVLLLFDIVYLLISSTNINISSITLKKAIGAIFLIGLIYSIGMSIFKFQGWTKTILIDFQNERLLTYFMIFLLGALCYKLKIFESDVTSKKLYIVINCQGKVLKTLNENSYNVYIIHVIVIGCIAVIMLNMTIPSLLKYLTLAVSTWVISNLIVSVYRNLIRSKI